MRILSRYTLKEFITFLFFCILAFIAIFILVDLVEDFDKFVDNKVPFHIVALYYIAYLPYITVLTMPVAMLLATMFSLGRLVGDNEVTAMKASGVSLYRILLPLYGFAFFIGLVSMGFAEYVVPRTNILRQDIMDIAKAKEDVGLDDLSFGLTKRREMDRHNVYLRNGDGRFVYAQFYNSNMHIATNVSIYTPYNLDRNAAEHPFAGFQNRIDAKQRAYKDSAWVLTDVLRRDFTDEGAQLRTTRVMDAGFITLEPSDFARIDLEPEEMNYFELKNYIEQVKLKGGDASSWYVDLHLKLSFPFASLIIVFFGAPMVAGSQMRGKTAAFGVALVICFVYYMLINSFKIIGRSDAVDPMLAAWIPNILFFFIGIFMHTKAAK